MLEIEVKTDFRPYRKGKLTKKLTNFTDKYALVGIFGNKAKKKVVNNKTGKTSKYTVGEIAVRNEFGVEAYTTKKTVKFPHPTIPKKWIVIPAGTRIRRQPGRPAIRRVVKGGNKYHKELVRRVSKRIFNLFKTNDNAPVRAWKDIGAIAKEITLKSYTAGDFKSNTAFTQNLKGFDSPLVDTGNTAKAIDYKIKGGSEFSLKKTVQNSVLKKL